MSKTEDMKSWLVKFCKDVFVEQSRVEDARSIVKGGVDGFCARHGTPDEAGEKRLLEQAIWFTHDTALLDSRASVGDKRDAVLEHLEKVNGR